MKKLDARKLSAGQQEILRRNAVELVVQGMAQTRVARELGVSRSAVAGWLSAWRKEGESALASRVRGRPSGTGILSADVQTEFLNALLTRMPDDFGLDARVWSVGAFHDLLRRSRGISATPAAVSLWLRRWGLSALLPAVNIAAEYDEDASLCAVWYLTAYPRIRRLARKQRARILLFGERALPERPFRVLYAVDGRGTVRFAVFRLPVTAGNRTDFMERLILDIGRPVILLLDSHPNHANGAIHRWQHQNANRITLCHIPVSDLSRLPSECWPFKFEKHGEKVG